MAPSSTATSTKDEGVGFIGQLVGIFLFIFLVVAIQPFIGFMKQLPTLIRTIFGIFSLVFVFGVPMLTGAYVSHKIKNS